MKTLLEPAQAVVDAHAAPAVAGVMPVYKVVLVGDGSVGKSSLIRRHATGSFEESRVMTIGVDFHTQIVNLGMERRVKLTIWDIAGQERFAFFRRNFYRGARAAALIFDVCNPETLHDLALWRDEVLKAAPGARMMVVGNKIDKARIVMPLEARAWCRAMGLPYIETSALTGEGVERLFEGLGWLAAVH
jgi:small GTP-binding protein